MKKIFVFIILGIFLLAGAVAFTVIDNGNILIENEEFSTITNNQIANYMENNLQMTRYKLLPGKIITYYNITYVEPTHDENNSYKVFTQEKPFIISIKLWNFCLNKTIKENCKNYLIDRETPYYLIEEIEKEVILEDEVIMEIEIINTTIKSTYLQAYEEQVRQYQKAIKFRDKAINNELEELINLI